MLALMLPLGYCLLAAGIGQLILLALGIPQSHAALAGLMAVLEIGIGVVLVALGQAWLPRRRE